MTIKVSESQTSNPAPVVATLRPSVRIILADSDPSFLSSLRDCLIAQPNYQVVARVESCMDALIWCEELSPQILILDWHLMFEGLLPAEMKGTAFLQKVKDLKQAPAVIVASRLNLDDHRIAALAAGADEFMPKAKFPQLIHPLIQQFTPRP